MPAIRNSVLMILAAKTSKDLLSREGKEQLALEIQREAVRPMGIEVATPEPVTMAPTVAAPVGASAPASASAAEAAASAKAKPRRRAENQRNPIQHVHFSSFIIQ
jgi:flagellar FliL protein